MLSQKQINEIYIKAYCKKSLLNFDEFKREKLISQRSYTSQYGKPTYLVFSLNNGNNWIRLQEKDLKELEHYRDA